MSSGGAIGCALVRGVPGSYVGATVRAPRAEPIDLERMRAQHAAYGAALAGLGLEVVALPPDEAHPDAPFVEDQAVVAAGRALITRSGHAARRGEAAAVAEALSRWLDVRRMSEGHLDGGDVLRIGRRLYVGRSARTDAAGIAALRDAFEPLGIEVRELAVGDALHLKCHCSSPVEGVVLLAEGWVDPAPFADVAEIVTVPRGEAYAANAVGRGDRVLIASGFPETRRRLEARGLEVIALETTEIAKGDGSLTCLSILF